jgi:tungstate transport system substrate-binding protein
VGRPTEALNIPASWGRASARPYQRRHIAVTRCDGAAEAAPSTRIAMDLPFGGGSYNQPRMMQFRWLLLTLILLCNSAFAQTHLRLATTTSTENTGLLAAILPAFEARFGLKVDVIAVGSGKAMKLGENGDVDVVLSHAPALEEAFVTAGFGVNRRSVMYNDFVIVGPRDDPAKVAAAKSAADAFKQIAAAQSAFISRGDESGTHEKEKELWKTADITPAGAWYISAGLGMGQTLQMADEKRAYTLSDRGTYLTYRAKGDLALLNQGDQALFNPYSIIAVNPARYPTVRYLDAMSLIDWMTSPEGQRMIGDFKVASEVLFHPTAVPPP